MSGILCRAVLPVLLVFPLFAQTGGYLPPNPISPPAMVPLTPVAMPNPGPASTPQSSLPSTLDELANPLSLLNALGGTESGVDSVDALSALLGDDGASPLSGGGTGAVNAASLKKILELLEKQQAEQAKGPPVLPAAPRTTSGAEIVRFTVNNYNLAATATSVLSSVLDTDGSFLLTGERTYISSYKERSETFYLLCKKTGESSYLLYTDVSQDYENEYSYIYRLVRKSPLSGTLTGDLLVFRNTDPAWNLNLVIRLFKPTVSMPYRR